MSQVNTPLESLAERLDEVSRDVTNRIRAEAPSYEALDRDQHLRDVGLQIRRIVLGLVERVPPGPDDIAFAREVGRRRAMLEIPLPALIDAYHIAYREIWSDLLAQATEAEQTSALTNDVAFLWNWLHQVSSAAAEAHADQTRAQATARASLRRRFLDLLSDSMASHSETRDVAKRLGFDPDASFVVASAVGIGETMLEDLSAKLSASRGVVNGCFDDTRTVFVAQGYSAGDLSASIHAQAAHAILGIGMSRDGLTGARMSLLDSTDALARAQGVSHGVHFAEDWLLCILSAQADRLASLTTTAAAVKRDHPAWAQTVLAYAAGNSSVTAAAQRLYIHANTAKYRLERWHSRTGWDPFTFTGLATSLIALGLSDPVAASPLTQMPSARCAQVAARSQSR